MEQQKLRTLKILEAVDNGETPSQRDLARQLNISLGLVNSFVKRLVNKGYFKITTIPRNRVKYILTRKGAAEKTRLTYEYIQYSFSYYREMRRRLRKLYSGLEKQGTRDIAFCGASELAEIALLILREYRINLVAIFDLSPSRENFFEYRIMPIDKIHNIQFDRVFVTALKNPEQIAAKIHEAGIDDELIITVE